MNTDTKDTKADTSAKANPKADTLLEFPCEFPLKVMGRNHADFSKDICNLVENFISHDIALDKVEARASRSGKYTALTVTITAESKAQLDEIYQALYAHDDVKMTL